MLVQDHTASLGPTRHREVATYNSRETTGPIMLQYHHSAVRFRNIWVRPVATPAARPDWPFFAFDNGTGRGRLSFDQQAQMLKELGYDGIVFVGTAHIPEMLKALNARGLRMFGIYVARVRRSRQAALRSGPEAGHRATQGTRHADLAPRRGRKAFVRRPGRPGGGHPPRDC